MYVMESASLYRGQLYPKKCDRYRLTGVTKRHSLIQSLTDSKKHAPVSKFAGTCLELSSSSLVKLFASISIIAVCIEIAWCEFVGNLGYHLIPSQNDSYKAAIPNGS